MTDKVGLIRRLLSRRIADDPAAPPGVDIAASLDPMMVMGMPEATIVTCVESWASLTEQGLSESDAAAAIASGRGQVASVTVPEVIRSCVQSEHGHSGFLPDAHIDWCIDEAKAAYGLES